jgi:PhnB protein
MPVTAVTPYLAVRDAAAALDFYKRAFGAEEKMRIAGPDGKIGHAEIKIGDAVVMLADEFPDIGFLSPHTLNGTTLSLHLLVPNVDEVVNRAVTAGAKLERPVQHQFYGERTGTILDPFGHRWSIGTVVEQLTNDEIERRAQATRT